MAKFKYVATGADGNQLIGNLKGSSVEGVTDSLQRQGLQVRSVKLQRRKVFNLELTPKKVDRVELGNFSRQMAAFITAGVPLLDALEVIQSESEDKTLRVVLVDVMDSLRFGDSFAQAMALHAEAFPPFYVSVLRSAEATGDLDVVLTQLARYIERDNEARRKIRSALTYPSLVMAMAAVTVVILTVFVLPRFKTFFQSFHAKLPLATRLLLSFTNVLIHWWPLIVAVFVVLFILGILAWRTERGRGIRDRVLLRLPVAGDVVRFTVIERFCRVLTSMIQAGVPIPEALRLATSGANNRVYQKSLVVAREQMLEGEGISRPIARTKLFPGTVTQMMRVGEETGSLDDQLENVASYYERELEYKLKRLTNLFEPAAVILVGVIVGFVAIALISAIYGIFNQVKLQ
jgi:type IV pilus assembly protein PilC